MKRRRASAHGRWSRGWDAATARRSAVLACAPLLARWVQHLVQRTGIERLAQLGHADDAESEVELARHEHRMDAGLVLLSQIEHLGEDGRGAERVFP